jgi:hypothetical protein
VVREIWGWLAKVGGDGDGHWEVSWFGGGNVCDIGKCVVRYEVWKVRFTQIRDQGMGE